MNVYPSARPYSIQLRNPQAVALVGLVLGGLFLAFIIGYRSGKGVGYELALGGAASSVPRIPVAVRVPTSVSGDVAAGNVTPRNNGSSATRASETGSASSSSKAIATNKPANKAGDPSVSVSAVNSKNPATKVVSKSDNTDVASASSAERASLGRPGAVGNASVTAVASGSTVAKPALAPVEERLLAELMPKVSNDSPVNDQKQADAGATNGGVQDSGTTVADSAAGSSIEAGGNLAEPTSAQTEKPLIQRVSNEAADIEVKAEINPVTKASSEGVVATGSSVPVTDAPVKTSVAASAQERVPSSLTPSATELAKSTNGRVVAKLPVGAKPAVSLKVATPSAQKIPAATSSSTPAKLAANASKVASGWYAQVGAPERLGDAEAVARRLRAQGYPVVIENAQVRGAVYYRVLVGKSSSKEQASALLSRLQREKSLPAKPFVKYMK